MKIVLAENCMGHYLEVDGTDIAILSEEDQLNVIKKVVSEIGIIEALGVIVGKYATDSIYDDNPCDQCGHHYEESVLEIEDEI